MPRFLALLALSVLLVPIAFAQELAPIVLSAEPTSPPAVSAALTTWQEIIGMVRDSFAAAMLAGVTGILGWFGMRFEKTNAVSTDAKETKENVDWEILLDRAADKVFSLVAIKLKITPENLASYEEKEGFLSYATTLFRRMYPSLATFIDKDQNGIPDFLENDAVDVDGVRQELHAKLFKLAPADTFNRPELKETTRRPMVQEPGDAPAQETLGLIGTRTNPGPTRAARSTRDMAAMLRPANRKPS